MTGVIIPQVIYNNKNTQLHSSNLDEEYDLLCSWFYDITLKENTIEQKPEYSRKNKKWALDEDKLLLEMYENEFSPQQMEIEFKYTRPIGGIKARLNRLIKLKNTENQMIVDQKQMPLKNMIQNLTYQTISNDHITNIQLWMHNWLMKKARSMAKKDTQLKWNRYDTKNMIDDDEEDDNEDYDNENDGGEDEDDIVVPNRNYKNIYTAQQLFPKILDAYQKSNLKCYYCHRWLLFQNYANCSKSTAASFDHAIPKRPVLTPNNRFYLSCRMCNYAKHVFTFEQYQHFIHTIRYSSNKRPSIIPLHQQDKDWICKKGLPLYKRQHNIIKSRCEERGYKFIDNANNIINGNDMMEIANKHGLIDPYTNLKGHYGMLNNDDLSECFQLVFGRKKKKEIDVDNGMIMEHGYYFENIQPMFKIIKYAFYTFDENEVMAWIHAIRSAK